MQTEEHWGLSTDAEGAGLYDRRKLGRESMGHLYSVSTREEIQVDFRGLWSHGNSYALSGGSTCRYLLMSDRVQRPSRAWQQDAATLALSGVPGPHSSGPIH